MESLPPNRPITLVSFIDEFMPLYAAPIRARSTRLRMHQVLRSVADLCGPGATTADLTPHLLVRLIASRPSAESPHTTNGLLRSLRVACHYAVGRGYLQVSPFALRRVFLRTPPSGDKQRHHPLEAIARVLVIAKEDIDRKMPGSPSQWRARRLYALVALAAYTGMRRNEILYLRVEDIDIPGRIIRIVSRAENRLKTELSAQPIPMPDSLARILAEWIPFLSLPPDAPEFATTRGPKPVANPDGRTDPGWLIPNAYRTGPWIGGPSRIGRPIDRLKRLGRRAGYEGFTFQSLRHSWATHAEGPWGLSELQVQRVLRHSTVKTQKHYRHVDLANIRETVRGVGFGVESASPLPVSQSIDYSPPAIPPPPLQSIDFVAPPPISKNPSRKGVRTSTPKLTKSDVAEMRDLRARGWTYTELLLRYRVARSTLHSALRGLTHADVPPATDS